MVKYINNIKVIIVLAVVSIFFAFSSSQNNAKPISEVEVSFIGENNLFISKTKVDKLLIQNNDYIKCVSKDILDLKALENKLSTHDMIENSEVYISINGILKIDIKQRNPYARVISDPSFISSVIILPPNGITAVWRIIPSLKTAKSVVPPPMSIKATPASFSS